MIIMIFLFINFNIDTTIYIFINNNGINITFFIFWDQYTSYEYKISI